MWGTADGYVSIARKARFAGPPQLYAGIDRGLALNPAHRPQSVVELQGLLGFVRNLEPPPLPKPPPPIPQAALKGQQRAPYPAPAPVLPQRAPEPTAPPQPAIQGSLRGKIAALDTATGAGVIQTAEGMRFVFTRTGVLDQRSQLSVGMEVEFIAMGMTASAVEPFLARR
jgi:hypothetical protein